MSAPETKIITKLLERRQIEADLRDMLEATSDLEFRRRAQRIADQGQEVLPAIVANLDQADARMLTAMGMVTTFLDREESVRTLRQAVLQSRLTDQGRVAAMTILQRFLGQAPDEQLLESLADPEAVALSSLEEILKQAAKEPAVLVEYVEALDRQEPDVVLSVVRRLEGAAQGIGPTSNSWVEERNIGLEPEQVVELLRLMAQDVREEVAAAAVEALGTLRLPEAAQALQSLVPALAPDLQPAAERLLRKLQFSGVEVRPLPAPDPEWRALISPPGGRGQQSVWFILPEQGAPHARFLNLLIHDRAGLVEAVGHPQVPALMLPPRRPAGHVHDVALPDGAGVMLMLEGSFDLGRRLVRDALADNRETQIPVAGALRLLSPWLWCSAGADALPTRRLPQLENETALARHSDRLLAQPAFVSWTLRGEILLDTAEEIQRHPGRDLDVWVRRLAAELFSNPEVTEAFQQRLTAMSEWLLLSGGEASARLALATANALGARAADQLFVQALIRRDLVLILENAKQYPGHLSGKE